MWRVSQGEEEVNLGVFTAKNHHVANVNSVQVLGTLPAGAPMPKESMVLAIIAALL